MTGAARIAGYQPGSNGGKTDKESQTNVLGQIGFENLNKLRGELQKEDEKMGLSWLTPEYVLSSINTLATDPKTPARSKITALELLGKSLALFTDKIETQNKILQIVGELKTEWRENVPQNTV